MNNKKCIVILYAKGVQDSAALALSEYLEKKYPKDMFVCPISDDELAVWHSSTLRRRSYIFANRNFIYLNKLSYGAKHFMHGVKVRKTKKPLREYRRPEDGFKGWCFKISTKYHKVYNALYRFDPELVICLTPKLLSRAIEAKRKLNQPRMSICAMITDYSLDPLFVNYHADGYFAQNASVKQMLVSKGVEEDDVMVVGTPIQESAKAVHVKEEVLQELDIESNRPNILIVGGRYGSSRIKEIFSKALEMSDIFNIILMTGESDSISKYCAYAANSKKKTDNIYIVEAVDDMTKYYAIADIIVAAPTAQITYEAMYHAKKLVLFRGSDKLENAGAHYLSSNSLALMGNNPDEVLASIEKYSEDSAFGEEVAKAQKAFTEMDGAETMGELCRQIMSINFEAKQDILKKRQELQQNAKSKVENTAVQQVIQDMQSQPSEEKQAVVAEDVEQVESEQENNAKEDVVVQEDDPMTVAIEAPKPKNLGQSTKKTVKKK